MAAPAREAVSPPGPHYFEGSLEARRNTCHSRYDRDAGRDGVAQIQGNVAKIEEVMPARLTPGGGRTVSERVGSRAAGLRTEGNKETNQ